MKRLSFVGTMIIVPLLTGLASGQQPKMAPLNPRFVEWQANKSAEDPRFGYLPSPIDWAALQAPISKASPQPLYDPRAQMTPVKDQSSCGACWAFAGCATIEGLLSRNYSVTYDFSENHMKNTHGFLWTSCAGGNNDMITAYLSRGAGPLLEADDPYNPTTQTLPAPGAKPQQYCGWAPVFTLGPGGDRTTMQNALLNVGPMATHMTWNDSGYNSSTKTYYWNSLAGYGHMVTLIGWDDNKVVPGAPGLGAWICKNSWGTSWGESGYFYLSYYDLDGGKDGYGFWGLNSASTINHIYQYDPLGYTSSMGYDTSDWAANVFTATANEFIIGVGTFLTDYNTSYQISVYNSGFSGGGFSNLVASKSGTFVQPGYYAIGFGTPISVTTGQKFSVVVHYTTATSNFPIPMETPIGGYAAPTAGAGQSYFSDDGSNWQDMTSAYANTNVCIKALAFLPPTLMIGGPDLVEVGDPVTLTAVLSNVSGTVSYQWYKDGAPLAGETNVSYVITSAILANAGVYTVVATDQSSNSLTSSPLQLKVMPQGSLPIAGMAGLCAFSAVIAGLAVFRRRR